MSATSPSRQTPPPGLPAPPRRVGKKPVWIVAGVGTASLAVLGWLLISMGRQKDMEAATAVDLTSSAPPEEMFTGSNASGGYSDLFNTAAATPAPATTGTPTDTSAPTDRAAPADTGQAQQMLDVHQQARLAAWQSYYQGLQALQQERHRAALTAMSAGMTPQTGQGQAPPQAHDPALAGAQQDASAAMAAVAGMMGGAGAGRGQQRPGTMDQGPANAGNLYLATMPVASISQYELKRAVSVIPFRLDQDIQTGAAGQFTMTVTRNVMAYHDPESILIPQGARLVGVYEDNTTAADERMKAGIVLIIYPRTGNPACPGGEELPLGSMPAADASGKAGFKDRVERHTWRRLFNASIQAMGGGVSTLAGAGGYNPGTAFGSQMASANLNAFAAGRRDITPTFETRAGYPGILQLTKTIAFAQPWVPGIGFCGEAPQVDVQ